MTTWFQWASALLSVVVFIIPVQSHSGTCNDEFTHLQRYQADRDREFARAAETVAWGNTRLKAGDLETALQAAEQALTMGSRNDVSALTLRTEALLGLRIYEDALVTITQALIIDGQYNGYSQELRARALLGLGRYQEARVAIEQAIAMRPNDILRTLAVQREIQSHLFKTRI